MWCQTEHLFSVWLQHWVENILTENKDMQWASITFPSSRKIIPLSYGGNIHTAFTILHWKLSASVPIDYKLIHIRMPAYQPFCRFDLPLLLPYLVLRHGQRIIYMKGRKIKKKKEQKGERTLLLNCGQVLGKGSIPRPGREGISQANQPLANTRIPAPLNLVAPCQAHLAEVETETKYSEYLLPLTLRCPQKREGGKKERKSSWRAKRNVSESLKVIDSNEAPTSKTSYSSRSTGRVQNRFPVSLSMKNKFKGSWSTPRPLIE